VGILKHLGARAGNSLMASSTLLRRILLLSVVVLPAVAAGQLIRINCGASAPANDSTGLAWAGDAVSKSTPSVAAVAAYQGPSLPSAVPYMTARVFASTYTCTFPVVGRRVFLRLFFYPCPLRRRRRRRHAAARLQRVPERSAPPPTSSASSPSTSAPAPAALTSRSPRPSPCTTRS
jgi:hypothetical protein